MARFFRYYGKKRGNRRTGSPTMASAGEAVFFGVFLLLGCTGLVLLFSNVVMPEWRVNHEFVETTCKVLDKRIGEARGEDGLLYRPEFRIEYEAAGDVYRDWKYDVHRAYSNGRENSQAVLDRFAVGNRYLCWYDPLEPDVAVLVRGYGWWIWLAFTVPVSFIALGGGGLIYALFHWGKSAERRAVMARRAAGRDPFGAGQPSHPNVPRGADMTNSPGTRLRYRLPIGAARGWALFGILAFCVVWNGIVAVFAAIVIRNHAAGRPDWLFTIFLLPFVLVGIGAILWFVRELLVAAGIGPTLLEISDHPLRPGGEYHLFLSQTGRLSIKAFRVALCCEESATYRQGTNTRTESQEVFCEEVFCREDFAIQSGLPLEAEILLRVPDGAMHSFKADHNEIGWALVVRGNVAGWPDFKRSFPVVVQPAGGGTSP